jgi:hypothetical protein
MKIVHWCRGPDFQLGPPFKKVLNGCIKYPFDNTHRLMLPWPNDGKPIYKTAEENQAAIVSYCHLLVLFFFGFVHHPLLTVNIFW